MSSTYPVINIEYKNRKPSRAVIMRTLAAYLEQGGKCFDIRWGENWIELNYHPSQQCWYGSGWIKEIGGDDLAQELNQIRKQAVREVKTLMQAAQAMGKLQIIHVG
jgi:hypothetical protein